ncbi:VOC family protein [Lacihabitans sp. LS3-19]|uniref:VOC family protein n=1 Tax=Lacihabitans sp. LS3-19 TaxID=2487335 RepID=UPI0020CEB453|nr:VOC family protein [Lacihabitans sp. LS3-19]MCP9768236.1 VOC family protein [Lacihabitans sp. LS3-19]
MEHEIYPCLWFDNQALEAAEFYCKVFKNSKILSSNPMTVMFELNGKKYMGLNGGPLFKFNESMSFVINCDTQEEIDYYWEAFTKEGQESQCGWLKDKFGLSWQIIPSVLGSLMSNPKKSQRVIAAFMKMKKMDIETLLNASENLN